METDPYRPSHNNGNQILAPFSACLRDSVTSMESATIHLCVHCTALKCVVGVMPIVFLENLICHQHVVKKMVEHLDCYPHLGFVA